MADKRLAKYVKDMLDRGYNRDLIRMHLLKAGYNFSEITQVFNELYSHEVKHVIHFSPLTVLVILIVAAALIGSFYFTTSAKKPAGKLLDLSLEPVSTTVPTGGEIVFILELDNKGSETRFDVNIMHELISKKTFEIASSKTETKAVETFTTAKAKFRLPEDITAGDYILRVIAVYDSKKAVATLPVKVTSDKEGGEDAREGIIGERIAESCSDGIKNQNEESVDCGGVCRPCQKVESDAKEDFEEEYLPKAQADQIDYSGMDAFEILDRIKEKAMYDGAGAFEDCNKVFEADNLKFSCYSNVAEASLKIDYCNEIKDSRIKDECFSNLAKAKLDAVICKNIKDDGRKDSCYFSFAIDYNDYSACRFITNKNVKETCRSLGGFG